MKSKVIAGFQLTCIGDDRHYTYLASRNGNTRIDRIAKRILSKKPNYIEYSYLGCGSDERTHSSARVDLRFISIMRTRYGDYPEYHSSEGDLETVVTPIGLQGGLDAVKECLDVLEREQVLTTTTYGEPQLGKRGLCHTKLNKNTSDEVMLRTNVLAYADGHHDVSDMVEIFKVNREVIESMAAELVAHRRTLSGLGSSWLAMRTGSTRISEPHFRCLNKERLLLAVVKELQVRTPAFAIAHNAHSCEARGKKQIRKTVPVIHPPMAILFLMAQFENPLQGCIRVLGFVLLHNQIQVRNSNPCHTLGFQYTETLSRKILGHGTWQVFKDVRRKDVVDGIVLKWESARKVQVMNLAPQPPSVVGGL